MLGKRAEKEETPPFIPSAVIDVQNLTKRYGDVTVVNDLSFKVHRGTTVALLGGNGAGKTTTISMLMGVLLPTSGSIRVLGENMIRDRFRIMHRINFSSPYVDMPKRLSVRQNLMFFARLFGLKKPRDRIAELVNDLQLKDFLKRPVGTLSAGQKTRVSVAKALINRPDILFLDEPTASLDPDTADWLRSYLEDYQRQSGAAIMLASHNMAEVERLCDHVLMMKNGQIVDNGTPEGLLERYGRTNMEEVFLDIARDRQKIEPDNLPEFNNGGQGHE
ncbi:ABC transporter ATP-binding protein [Kiloniella sp. b19]|uniref:ABC transporter ATP-binding protein n=1 Tax=Kiloniella sp. GXU_MW_B19 TaxID=3141326 RepID=UPI0031D4511F